MPIRPVFGESLAQDVGTRQVLRVAAQILSSWARSFLKLVAYPRPYCKRAHRRGFSRCADLGSYHSTMFVFRLQVSLDKISNDGPVSLISFEDLKMENERLQVELDRTKKVNCQPSPIPFLIFFWTFFNPMSIPRDWERVWSCLARRLGSSCCVIKFTGEAQSFRRKNCLERIHVVKLLFMVWLWVRVFVFVWFLTNQVVTAIQKSVSYQTNNRVRYYWMKWVHSFLSLYLWLAVSSLFQLFSFVLRASISFRIHNKWFVLLPAVHLFVN